MKTKCLLVLLLALGYCHHTLAQGSKKPPLSEALTQLNKKVDSPSVPETGQRPLIGISTDIDPKRIAVNAVYVQSVILSGGIPYLIPVTDNVEVLRQIVSMLDGIIFTGGQDIQPDYYGETPNKKLGEVNQLRDIFDLSLMKMATDCNMPILGICRGLQLLNVSFGGTLYQDLPSQHPSEINHNQDVPGTIPTHTASIVKGTQLAEIMNLDELQVNTFHHQAVKQLAPEFKVAAWSPDSVVEAIEAYPVRQILGVQFHPEIFTASGNETMRKLFRHLINKAETFKRFKEIDTFNQVRKTPSLPVPKHQ